MSQLLHHLPDFTDRLEAVRRNHGREVNKPRLSMAEFAGMLGVSGARYRRYERGEIDPPLHVLAAVRRVTGVSLDWLLDANLLRQSDIARSQIAREAADSLTS